MPRPTLTSQRNGMYTPQQQSTSQDITEEVQDALKEENLLLLNLIGSQEISEEVPANQDTLYSDQDELNVLDGIAQDQHTSELIPQAEEKHFTAHDLDEFTLTAHPLVEKNPSEDIQQEAQNELPHAQILDGPEDVVLSFGKEELLSEHQQTSEHVRKEEQKDFEGSDHNEINGYPAKEEQTSDGTIPEEVHPELIITPLIDYTVQHQEITQEEYTAKSDQETNVAANHKIMDCDQDEFNTLKDSAEERLDREEEQKDVAENDCANVITTEDPSEEVEEKEEGN